MTDRVALIRSTYEAWSQGDLERLLTAVDPEIDYYSSGAFPGLQEHYRGHEGMRRFWADFRELWEELAVHPTRIEEVGDLAVALVEFDGAGRGGVRVRRRAAQVMRFRGDRVIWVKSFGDWESALAALSDQRAAD